MAKLDIHVPQVHVQAVHRSRAHATAGRPLGSPTVSASGRPPSIRALRVETTQARTPTCGLVRGSAGCVEGAWSGCHGSSGAMES
eukprot:scaffold4590_cov389-Prasinococcus_capsulatus_cf.AAC.8